MITGKINIGDTIRWKMYLPVSITKAFNALDTDEGRESFWAESANFENGSITFEFINGIRYQSKIIEKEPPYIWAIDYFGGVARFELKEKDNGTELLLTHSGVAVEDWIETYAGWLNVLFPLKAWLVHGVDLRNHDPNRTWDDGYADQ